MKLPEKFVYLNDIDPSIRCDLKYYSEDNFVGHRIDGYAANVAICTEHAAIALRSAQKEFSKLGYGIVIFDAYRPHRAVEHFLRWAHDIEDIKMQSIYYPTYNNKEQLFSDGFIARYSKHSRGSTIDLTLFELSTEEQLDMGSIFDFFGPISFTDSQDIPSHARKNRMLLKSVMNNNGFTNYEKEWWHYELQNEPFTLKPEHHFDFLIK